MKSIEELRRLRDKAAARLAAINKQIDELLAKTIVVCENQACQSRHEIGSLVYLQTHWYEEPHGCTGGDKWHPSEGQWECPNCLRVMRLYKDPETTALKWHFKGVRDVYRDNS